MSNELNTLDNSQSTQLPPVKQQIEIKTVDPQLAKFRMIAYLAIAALILILIFGGAAGFYAWTHKPVVYETQEKASTPSGMKDIALKAGFKISDFQSKEASEWVANIAKNNTPPDYSVTTTGKDYKQEVEKQSKANNADVTVVTDPKKPNEKPNPKPGDVVVLNQYNQQFFPKREIGVTIYNDQSIAIDYNSQIKVFGSSFYWGPSVMYDNKQKDLKVGIRLSKPL